MLKRTPRWTDDHHFVAERFHGTLQHGRCDLRPRGRIVIERAVWFDGADRNTSPVRDAGECATLPGDGPPGGCGNVPPPFGGGALCQR
jgi:hypothetical protein